MMKKLYTKVYKIISRGKKYLLYYCKENYKNQEDRIFIFIYYSISACVIDVFSHA